MVLKILKLSIENKKRIILTLFFSILAFSVCQSQISSTLNDRPTMKERLFFGGSFGLQLGTITDIELSPVAGIWLLPRLAIATGPNYRFYKDPYGRTDIYGGRLYSELMIIQALDKIIPVGANTGIFFHLEDEILCLQSSFWKINPGDSERFSINTILAGAGISQMMGVRSSFNFMVLWALNDPLYEVYGNPEIRISFYF